MKHFRNALIFAFASMTAAIPNAPAWAEHEADHRYTVRGYVLDKQRQPLAGQRVGIQGHGTATTDSSGAYSIRLHLHNEDLGKVLQIRTGGIEHTLRVSFDPSDTRTARIHHANFVGSELVEGEISGVGGFPLWGYAAAGIGALTAGGLLLAVKRRGARRRRAAAASAQPARRGKARKKRRKRRH